MVNYDYLSITTELFGREVDIETQSHVNLWNAVLNRAISDMFSTSLKFFLLAEQTRSWVQRKDRNFNLVCEMANKDPEYMYEKLMIKLNKCEGIFTSQLERYNKYNTLHTKCRKEKAILKKFMSDPIINKDKIVFIKEKIENLQKHLKNVMKADRNRKDEEVYINNIIAQLH